MRFLALVIILTAIQPALGEGTGSVSGTVPLPKRAAGRIAVEKYTGSISGKVAKPPAPRAAVWLEGPGAAAEANPAPVTLAQKGYQFADRVVVIATGTTVSFPNEDDDFHNIFSLSAAKRFEIGRYKKVENPAPRETFTKPGVVRLGCQIHEHMRAYIVVVDSRWRAVTDSSGRFTLNGVAPGNYTLHARIDDKTAYATPVRVEAGVKTEAAFTNRESLP